MAGTNSKCNISPILRASSPPLSVSQSKPSTSLIHTDSIVIKGKSVPAEVYDHIRGEIKRLNGGLKDQTFESEVLVEHRDDDTQLKMDIVVMEVRVGVRLGATNAIPDEAAVASPLTSVDLDRRRFLGSGGDFEREATRVREAEVPRGSEDRQKRRTGGRYPRSFLPSR